MSRISYVNGRYRRADEANVNIEDRGYQFSDGVYEVCLLVDGRFLDEKQYGRDTLNNFVVNEAFVKKNMESKTLLANNSVICLTKIQVEL